MVNCENIEQFIQMYVNGESIDNIGFENDETYDECFAYLLEHHDSKENKYLLGYFYYDEIGTDQNLEEAMKWFKKAAEEGSCDAQFMMYTMLCTGEGCQLNREEANKYLKMAADNGDDLSQFVLGLDYHCGNTIKRDDELAFKYISMSAQQGNAGALYELGTFYNEGIGCDSDYEMAKKYFDLAKANNELFK